MKGRFFAAAIAAALVAGSGYAQMMGGGMGRGDETRFNSIGRNVTAVPGYGMHYGVVGPGVLAALGLSDTQRAAIAAIEDDFARTQWEIMGEMQALQWRSFGPQAQGPSGSGYEEMAALRREMLAAGDDARAHIDAVLTVEQRERMRRLSSCWPSS